MEGLLIIAVLLAAIACFSVWWLLHQLKRRRLMSTVIWSAQGLLWLGGFVIVLLVYANLHTYQRLTHEQAVADIYIKQLEPRRFHLSLAYVDGNRETSRYELEGDQWQIDARILKWKGWANLIGLDAYYRLDRLSGRFDDIQTARNTPPDVHDLSGPDRGLDIWAMKRLLRGKMPFVDTLFGHGVFMPLADGARFRISVGQSGLIARPVNPVAREAVF